jgi:hypothetical protein
MSLQTASSISLRIPLWTRLVALLGALLSLAGGIISLVNPAMLTGPHDAINNAVHVYAGYTTARDLAVAILLLWLLAISARRALGQLLFLVALIQLIDAAIDCIEARWTIAPGVFILGILFFAAATRLTGPFWKASTWGL